MFDGIRSLLFSTNLLENCRPALEASIYLAAQHQAKIVLLHVIDSEVPEQKEEYIRSLMGEEKWKALKKEYEEEVRQSLIGKMSSEKMSKKAIRMYCRDSGIEPENCSFPWKDIVVNEKDVATTIVNQARENECDLIVLGAKRGFWGDTSVGSKIKGVMQKSDMPVMVVPAQKE